MIKAGIMGGAGYTGGELIRLLIHHPKIELCFVHSSSNAGKPIYAVHKDLLGDTELVFSDSIQDDIDVLFLCVGHGDAKKILSEQSFAQHIKIIDLSQDFRLKENSQHGDRAFVYGLPELNKAAITTAKNIANPGCFATAIQLALLPLAKVGILDEVHVTGITGSTGAGQGLSATSHFSWRANNIQAYKSLDHQHIFEITQSINQLQKDDPLSVSGEGKAIHFIPWRGDFTRGIYVSAVLDCGLPLSEVNALYKNFYENAVFTHVCDSMIDLKQVVNTNKCLIHIEKKGSKIVVHSCIDNLLKGASGQAVQNMNLVFGFPEETGLKLKANYF